MEPLITIIAYLCLFLQKGLMKGNVQTAKTQTSLWICVVYPKVLKYWDT